MVKKQNGKLFELRRVEDESQRDLNEEMDRLFQEMPATGAACKLNAAQIIIEERE